MNTLKKHRNKLALVGLLLLAAAPAARATDPVDPAGVQALASDGGTATKTSYGLYGGIFAGIFIAGTVFRGAKKGRAVA